MSVMAKTTLTTAEAIIQAMEFQKTGRLAEAEVLFRKVLEVAPKHAQALSQLGLLEQATGRASGLERVKDAVNLSPEASRLWFNYAKALQAANEAKKAEAAYKKTVSLEPDFYDGRLALANLLKRLDRTGEAVPHFEHAAKVQPGSAHAHLALGTALNDVRLYDRALKALESAYKLVPGSADVNMQLGLALSRMNRSRDSLKFFAQAFQLNPASATARWHAALTLPIFYENMEEIDEWRDRWEKGVRMLDEKLDLSSEDGVRNALNAACSITHFYLNYQGRHDRQLQELFGGLTSRIAAAAFPKFAETAAQAPAERVRVGVMSHFFRLHSISKTHGAWATGLDREKFEVTLVYTGTSKDQMTEKLASQCEHFLHRSLTGSLSNEQFLADLRGRRFDVLIYPDLGMTPAYGVIAALPLAPVQCNGLGHPVTAGLPAVNVTLSSAAMEPEDGDAHYSERLVRLDNLAYCYDDALFREPKTTFKRDHNGPVYVCSQNLSKILPDQDRLFARIAAEVPNSQLWFLSNFSDELSARFVQRVARAYEALGVRPEGRIRMLPRLSQQDFFAMYRAADVGLDGLAWNGCNTTFEALGCGLPVVTMPGDKMRARHAFGILRQAGLDELIARGPDQFVEIATALGRDKERLVHVRETIARDAHKVYNDPAPIRSLEAFLLEAAGRAALPAKRALAAS
jgi:predicted O-linked N-acetylglucosamine transferase (SPINDLY family)